MKTEGQKQSQHHEKRMAKVFSGKTVAASGAFWNRKGDVRTDTLLIEHKYTGKLQITVKSSVLDKIEKEAILDGRKPVLGIYVGGKSWVCIPEDDFVELLGTCELSAQSTG